MKRFNHIAFIVCFIVCVGCRGMGRDPDLWDNPLDFDPKRWIPFKQPDPYKFPVFQAGAHITNNNSAPLVSSGPAPLVQTETGASNRDLRCVF